MRLNLRPNLGFWIVILIVILNACTIDTYLPTQTGQYGLPAATNTSLPAPSGTGVAATGLNISPEQIPVTWGSMNISGHLIYTRAVVKDNQLSIVIQSLNLLTGDVTSIFQTTNDGWIDAAAISPDSHQIVISYTPPTGTAYAGQDDLYLMPLDGSTPPQLLFTPNSAQDQYYQPVWSPDGRYIYFSHISYSSPTTTYEIMRMALPHGSLEKVAESAYWPNLSADGAQLVYVTVDITNSTNKLFLANADGSKPHMIPVEGLQLRGVIDAPTFLADDQTILFSAPTVVKSFTPNPSVGKPGSTRISAHASIPSDWWSVSAKGGITKELTHTGSYSLFATLSPDKKYIVSYSSDEIFIMTPEGTNLTSLTNDTGGIPGTVDWIP